MFLKIIFDWWTAICRVSHGWSLRRDNSCSVASSDWARESPYEPLVCCRSKEPPKSPSTFSSQIVHHVKGLLDLNTRWILLVYYTSCVKSYSPLGVNVLTYQQTTIQPSPPDPKVKIYEFVWGLDQNNFPHRLKSVKIN